MDLEASTLRRRTSTFSFQGSAMKLERFTDEAQNPIPELQSVIGQAQ